VAQREVCKHSICYTVRGLLDTQESILRFSLQAMVHGVGPYRGLKGKTATRLQIRCHLHQHTVAVKVRWSPIWPEFNFDFTLGASETAAETGSRAGTNWQLMER
jgi:hypothetical protein